MMAKYKSGMIKGWKPYIFKIANATHIQCLDPKSSVSLCTFCEGHEQAVYNV